MDNRLQKFARLTEIGSFTKAAKELHISQPALSIAIDKLERELGAELMVRGNRTFKLTEAGQATYNAALEHQAATDHLRSELNRIAKRRPTVTLGMIDSVAAVLCATEAFEALEQAAKVTVVVNNSRYLREAIDRQQIDTALIVDDSGEYPGLTLRQAGAEELLLVCRPDVLQETEAELACGHLRNFICYDKPSTTSRLIMNALQLRGIKPHVSLYSSSPDVMLGMVSRGKGVGVLPRFLVDELVCQQQLCCPLYEGQQILIERPICSVSPKDRRHPACLQSFIAAVQL